MDDKVVPFKMAPKPEDASDSLIAKLFEDELKPAKALAAAMDRLEGIMHTPAELFFHTNKRRHLEFERVPVGHDLGWCCYDPNKLSGPDLVMGYGKTEDEAYVDWLDQSDDIKPRASRPIHSSPFEPTEYADEPRRDTRDDE